MINGTRHSSFINNQTFRQPKHNKPTTALFSYNESSAVQHRRVYRSPKTQGRRRKTNPTMYYPSTGLFELTEL